MGFSRRTNQDESGRADRDRGGASQRNIRIWNEDIDYGLPSRFDKLSFHAFTLFTLVLLQVHFVALQAAEAEGGGQSVTESSKAEALPI